MKVGLKIPQATNVSLPPTHDLLVSGGDPRIEIDPTTGANRYLCPAAPCAVAAFGSSTASIISPEGFDAAARLRQRLESALETESAGAVYARELSRLRTDLVGLCGLDGLPGLQTLFAASGTDIHLLAAQFVGGLGREPTLGVMVEATETGSGVGLALSGRHFATATAQGGAVLQGELAGGRAVDGIVTLAARTEHGSAVTAGALREALERAVVDLAPRARLLITVADVTKTGLISLDLPSVFELRRRFPERVEILIDACQFRLSPGSLRAYLDQGAMVAVTGSKFLCGPAFSGALFVPRGLAERFAGQSPSLALRAYAHRADLPEGWAAAADLTEGANFGLLLRWAAALEELRAFSAIAEWRVAQVLRAFAATVNARIAEDPGLEPVPVPQLDRRALGEGRWDSLQTIFPFLLRRPGGAGLLGPDETQRLYRTLAAQGIQVGQPVGCGLRDGHPLSALRFCASARLVVEASRPGGLKAVLGRIAPTFGAVTEAARRIAP